jgi:hypothetical protein
VTVESDLVKINFGMLPSDLEMVVGVRNTVCLALSFVFVQYFIFACIVVWIGHQLIDVIPSNT